MNVHQSEFMSLWDMLEINASAFLAAVTRLHALNIFGSSENLDQNDILQLQAKERVLDDVKGFIEAATVVGSKSALVAAVRLHGNLIEENCVITMGGLASALKDIESRFADHLHFIKLLIIQDDKINLFGGADILLGKHTADLFPSALFDCEEAAKCLCLGRYTACVFHAMRLLEIAIRAFAKRLRISDPTKPSEKSWGIMLGKIDQELKDSYPKNTRIAGSEGSFLEGLYATLDAVKNPWRNSTMHVESVYTEEEARHILNCTVILLQKMAGGFDENGVQVQSPSAQP